MIPSSEARPAVELIGFGKTFRRHWHEPAGAGVVDLSLRLARGRVLGLLGPNGSGKSTTLKALAGLIRPTRGVCLVCGHVAGSAAARAHVGYLPESARFAPHLTGREFLAFCGGLSGVGPPQVDRALAWCGLGAAADRRLGTYSKGMCQRIGLAQAIIHDPAVVLLDEPASGLDPEGRLALGRLIRDLAARGKAVVFSSHLLAPAEEICDFIALLGRGRLLVSGSREELLGRRRAPAPELSPLERLYLERAGGHG